MLTVQKKQPQLLNTPRLRHPQAADTLLDAAAVLNAVTQLKVNRAQPARGGMYVAAASPQVISDIMQDNDLVERCTVQ
jgi:hypothetical protein